MRSYESSCMIFMNINYIFTCILQVNDTNVENVTHAEAVDALKKAGSTVRMVIFFLLDDP